MSNPNPFALKQSKLLDQSKALINLEATFLDLKSQTELNKTCRAVSHVISPQLRQLKAEKLLDHVLNIDEKRKKEILSLLQNPDFGPLSAMLMYANGQVKYRSSKQGNQIIPRATYNNVSPIEAAASCGDFHLLKLFEDALPTKQKHRAGLQLQSIITSPNFLSAFNKLKTAYHTYVNCDPNLHERDWNAIDMLWEQVGEAQKNLSNFGLNVFCNPVPHVPCPDFTQEPERTMRSDVFEECNWKTVDLDLDSIGGGTQLGLYKGGPIAYSGNVSAAAELRRGPAVDEVQIDSDAFDRLCEVLSRELGNITERLLSYPVTQDQEQALPAGGFGAGLDSSKSRCVVS